MRVRCLGLAHARDAIFVISNCKYCGNFTLKILRARLAVFDRLFIRAAPEASAKPRPGLRMRSSRLWRVSSFHFLSLHRLGVNVQIFRSSFLTPVLHPAQRHGEPFPLEPLEDVLYTAVSESEDFGAASFDILTPSLAYTELLDVFCVRH